MRVREGEERGRERGNETQRNVITQLTPNACMPHDRTVLLHRCQFAVLTRIRSCSDGLEKEGNVLGNETEKKKERVCGANCF